ncbi:hydroxyacylglutathione hydrolase [Corallococcus sp. H22C18031201]|nr:hydroxyacylglutathione hydrolase [Corallococcus sp. H22C18031201]
MRARTSWDVFIVGGGASGTLLALHLLKSARAPLRVALVERGPRLGRGLAYGTDNPRHLLNVPAARMSALPDDPEHFLRWLRQQTPTTVPGAFVARHLFGQYLEEVLSQTRVQAAPGVVLEVLPGEVTDVAAEPEGLRWTLADGAQWTSRAGVLAAGNALPADLPVPDGGLYGSERYHRSPWAESSLQRIDAHAPVLLIGTGLTMVDAVLSLSDQGHQGPLHALSRHGLLPHVHRPVGAQAPALPESLRVRELLRAVRREVTPEPRATAEAPPLRVREVLRTVRHEVEAAGMDWRAVVDSLRPVTIPLWQRLDAPERRRFLRHLRSYWEVHRHRMAPDVGAAIDGLRREGRLHLHAARVRGFQWDGDTVDVRLRRRGTREESTLRVGHVVNCTGPNASLSARSHPLLRRVVDAGLAREDPLGLGLLTEAGGVLPHPGGDASERLYTLGPPRRGDLWETTAIPEIRLQARELAERLIQRLGAVNSPGEPARPSR